MSVLLQMRRKIIEKERGEREFRELMKAREDRR